MAKTVPAADNTITFTCPHCQLRTKLALEKVGHTYQCRVKCPCGNVFAAEIEFRERRRRLLDRPGSYEPILPTQEGAGAAAPSPCRIIDLSLTGLAFLKSDARQISLGQMVRVRFRLDDDEATEIIQECEVIHVKENFVGCSISDACPALEYYLLG